LNKASLLDDVRPGLIIAGFVLLFGILMGVAMGIFEDSIKDMINMGVDANAAVHLEGAAKAKTKIFRWWQRAHFHATGMGAFLLAMIAIVAISNLKTGMKRLSSILIALGGLYPFSWFIMSLKAPALGRSVAHHYLPAELLVFISMICLFAGMAILFSNIIFKSFSDK
jgi:hypothetical protein